MITVFEATRTGIGPDTGPEGTLLMELHDFTDLFDKEKASGLPPYRGPANYYIRLKTGLDGKSPELL
jgi:hypothetical protein